MSTAIAAARAKTKGKTLLKDILNAYGEIDSVEASADAIADWNRRKTEAIANGTWVWRESTMAFAVPKSKVAAAKIKGEFACLTTLSAELNAIVHGPTSPGKPAKDDENAQKKGCTWSAVIEGKFYTCTNELHSDAEMLLRRCNWHAVECRSPTHPPSSDKTIAVPNEDALCLACYAKSRSRQPKHRQTPPAFDQVMIPGVHRSEAQKVQAKLDIVSHAKVKPMAAGNVLTKASKCAWKGHKPGQKAFQPHVCHRSVLLHPVYDTYLSMCGYHQSPCVRNLTKGVVCPPIVQVNAHGLCHNHYEAYLATLSFDERRADKAYASPFDPPEVFMDGGSDKDNATVAPHPLAPKHPPPPLTNTSSGSAPPPTSVLRGTFTSFFDSWTAPLQTLWWQINYLRQGPRIATRLQAVFRGRRARKRVRRMLLDTYGRKRTKAAILLQKHWRAKQAQRHVVRYRDLLVRTTLLLQRIVRGFLSRRRVHHLRSFRRLCRVVGVYVAVRRAIFMLRFRVDTRRGLSRGSDRDRLIALSLLQRSHAAKVLVRAMRAWKKNKLEKLKQGELKFKTFLSAVVIQRAWKRYQKLKWLQRRYRAAQRIQARMRGDLTRCLWANDPGISSVVHWVNPRSGFAYVRYKLDPAPSPSYSVARRTMRRDVAARVIQLHFRGFAGRVAANTAWANMERRWQWIGPAQDRQALRTLLPHVFYHEDKDHHMRPIYNLPVPYRAFASEFQGVVDLLDDKHGLRCANLPPRPSPPTPLAVECPTTTDSTMSLRFPPTQSIIESCSLDAAGITSTMAMFPLGAMVYVHLRNKKTHPATIVRVHRATDTFDVAFLPGLVSIRGVAITEAKDVHVSRLQHEPPEPPPVTLTSRILDESRRVAALPTSAALSNNAPTGGIIPKRSWPDVASRFHALVTCVRDNHRRLAADPALWMRLVFDHRDFLDQYWLRLLHDVEHGNATDPHNQSSCPMEGMILPLPHVAKWMKTKLLALGFEATALANQAPPKPRHVGAKAVESPSPHSVIPTTYVDDLDAMFSRGEMKPQSPSSSRPHREASRDDLDTPNTSHVSLADIHKLVYHLKSLPGHAPDHVLQVTTRNVRTFVCSHPACGRCFSTREGARLHKELHTNKLRFAGGNPLVDQYMHKHWPPESPWRDENQMSIKGTTNTGFPCPVCDRSFSTKRDALRHASAVHGHEQPQERVSSTHPNIIWLGTSHSVNDITNRFPELRHPRVCPTCSRKMAHPDAVCRLYPSVCILMESAVIFATDFKALTPQFQVTCPDCGDCSESSGPKTTVYLDMHALCRDRHGVDWALGNLYHAPPTVASLGEALILGYDYTYEVLLQSPLVCMPLAHCNGSAMVHTCSRNYFHRKVKPVGTPCQIEKFCRALRPSSQCAKAPPPVTPPRARPEMSA